MIGPEALEADLPHAGSPLWVILSFSRSRADFDQAIHRVTGASIPEGLSNPRGVQIEVSEGGRPNFFKS